MQFATISILLIFISAVCASPLPNIFAPSNNDIQAISKRADQIPTTIEELKQRLGSVVVDPSKLDMIWMHDVQVPEIAGSREEGIFKLKNPYNGEKAILQEVKADRPVKYVIHLALYLNAAKMIRAFAEFPHPKAGHPGYIFILADHGYVSAREVPELAMGQLDELRILASKKLHPDMTPYAQYNNYVLKRTGDPKNPYDMVYL